jgi:hypothetical protein
MGTTGAYHPVRILTDIVRAGRGTPTGLESRQQDRFRRLVSFAREHSVFYGKMYSGLPSVIRDPGILPPVSKRDLMANFDGWATDDAVRRKTAEAFVADPSRIGRYYLDRHLAFSTSGTTGLPAVFLHESRVRGCGTLRGKAGSRPIGRKASPVLRRAMTVSFPANRRLRASNFHGFLPRRISPSTGGVP